MRRAVTPVVDGRRAGRILAELLARRPGYLPPWAPVPGSAGDGLSRVWARYLETLVERLDQSPEKNRLVFLGLAGIERIAATEARAPVAFQLGEGAPASSIPAGAKMAAPPPPESDSPSQIVFETERATGLIPGKLVEVASLWPGRDQWIDHRGAVEAGEPFRPFDPSLLEDTPHHLYLAHDTLLALAGRVELRIAVDLAQPGSERLEIEWEYFDGEVWRPFASRECGGTGTTAADGTGGLTTSGTTVLTTDCAEAAPTEVDGHEAFWVRGRLDEPLPLDPDQILPEATEIKLASIHRRDLRLRRSGFDAEYVAETPGLRVTIVDAGSGPVAGARVELALEGGAVVHAASTDDSGVYEHDFTTTADRPLHLTVLYQGDELTEKFVYEPPSGALARLQATLRVEIEALVPDKAFADADKLDLTKPFYPLGQAPRPGSTFHFAAPEVLAKAGAELTIHVETASTPQDELSLSSTPSGGSGGGLVVASKQPTALSHELSWEYYNGRRWSALQVVAAGDTDVARDFTADGTVELKVPNDAAPVEVEGEENLWLRVRVLEGSYGLRQEVSWDDGDGSTNRFVYVLPQPPALKSFRLAYVWQDGPHHAERVLAYNDFRYLDHTEAAKWPRDPFAPFTQLRDRTPTLYLGFEKPLPVDRLSLYFDLVESRGIELPALAWEAWTGSSWRHLGVEDETLNLAFPGTVSFIGPAGAEPLGRFGRDLYWVRARRAADGQPGEIEIRAIHPNTIWAAQRETVVEETLGESRGLPGESFRVRRPPVLADERIEVREVEGPRAAVEWRRLALELLASGEKAVRELERRLGDEGPALDVERGDLRLRRGPDKSVIEVWVRWHSSPTLLSSGADDRHYALDRASGTIAFGDGERGRVLPLGGRVLARRYVSGGGAAGNVASGAINQILTGVAGVEKIFNVAPAEGGADAETMASVARRGPRTLRHRGRGLAAPDLETLALEASPAVAVARALPLLDPAGIERPGFVTLVVVPRSDEPRPYPSVGLRERVRRYVEARAEAGLAGGRRLSVTGPEYFPVGIEATLIPFDPAAAGEVEARTREVLERILHPLTGGPEGDGWEPGRSVYRSDVAAALERVEGIDAVARLTLVTDGVPRGETLAVPPGGTVAAGELRLTVASGRR